MYFARFFKNHQNTMSTDAFLLSQQLNNPVINKPSSYFTTFIPYFQVLCKYLISSLRFIFKKLRLVLIFGEKYVMYEIRDVRNTRCTKYGSHEIGVIRITYNKVIHVHVLAKNFNNRSPTLTFT